MAEQADIRYQSLDMSVYFETQGLIPDTIPDRPMDVGV